MAFKKAGRYDEALLVRRGDNIIKAVTDADVHVLESDGSTAATLYSDAAKTTTEADNIVSPDSDGNLEFFANPGQYVLKVYVGGVLKRTDTVIVPPDPDELEFSEEDVFNVKDYGAVGDGATDDAAAIQAAIDACVAAGSGGTVLFGSGTYRLSVGLLLRNTSGDHLAAPRFVGAGRDVTVLEANFDNDAIMEVDGSSHTTFKFFWFGGIEGLTFKQVAGKTGVEGLRHNGWWRPGFRDWLVIGLSDDGIYFPDRTADISANYDAWSSQGWVLERCELRENTGWGINSDGSNGWGGVTLLNCGVQTNDAGGAKVAGSYWTFSTCTIASNGGPTTGTSGIHVTKQLDNHPHSLTVERCELDGNYTYHLFVEALVSGQVSLNRMVHQEDNTWGDSTNRPTTAVKLGDAATSGSMTVKDVEFARNFHRTDTTFNTAVTLYDFAHASAGLFCRIVGGAYGGMTSALTKFTGYDAIADAQEPYIRDLGVVVNEVDEAARDLAVARNLDVDGDARFKGHPWFDVTHPDFGAVGDGVTDDATAIQTAIDAAEAAGGGVVLFPEGTYLISSTLTVDGPGVTLMGHRGGMGAAGIVSELKAGAVMTRMIHVNVASGEKGAHVRHLKFDANSNATNGIEYAASQTLWQSLEHVSVYNATTGVLLGATFQVGMFNHLFIDGCATGVDCTSVAHLSITQSYIHADTLALRIGPDSNTGTAEAVYVSQSVISCESPTDQVILLRGCRSVTLRDCFLEVASASATTVTRVVAIGSTSGTAQSVLIDGCRIQGNLKANYAVELVNADHPRITNNLGLGLNTRGVLVTDTNTFGVVSHNQSFGAGSPVSATTGLIEVIGDSTLANAHHKTNIRMDADARLYGSDGTAASPSLTFQDDQDSGFYRVTADQIGVVAGGVRRLRFRATDLYIEDGINISIQSTTGTMIGTGAANKLAFYGATPIVRPGSTSDIKDALVALGLVTDGGATPLNLDGGALTFGGGTFTNVLTGDNTYLLLHQASVTRALDIKVKANTVAQLRINTDGKVEWGPGNNPVDTNLYRSDVDTLKTDDSLVVAGSLSGYRRNRTAVAVDTTISTPAQIVGCTAHSITVTLASAMVGEGVWVIIKDESGASGGVGQEITIATEGTETIDGAASLQLNQNYESVEIYSDGTNWFVQSATGTVI